MIGTLLLSLGSQSLEKGHLKFTTDILLNGIYDLQTEAFMMFSSGDLPS